MSRRGNYEAAVSLLLEQLQERGAGTVTVAEVAHDPDCPHWRGEPCGCRPDVRVVSSERVEPEGEDDA